MTWKLALVCLLAALIAVGAGTLLETWPRAPRWLIQIVTLALLLIAFLWLQTVLR